MIFGNKLGNKVLIASSIKVSATKPAPSCSPSYTNSILPVIAGITPIKSLSLIAVLDSPDTSNLRSAVLNKFSKAVILIRALTPLLASTYSLFLASKLICSNKSNANSGTCTNSDWRISNLASCLVIFLAMAISSG